MSSYKARRLYLLRQNSQLLPALDRVIKLLSDPDNWTTGASARDEADARVSVGNPNAVSWCLLGAISKEGGYGFNRDALMNLVSEIIQEQHDGEEYYSVASFNDHHTHEEVMNVLTLTRERLQNERKS